MFSPWPYKAIVYMVTSLLIGVLLVVIVAVTILILPFWAILLGNLERRRVRILGFQRIPNAHVPLRLKDWRIWFGVRTGEPTTWREVVCVFATIAFGLLSALLLIATCVPLFVLPVGMGIEFTRTPPEIQILGLHWTVPEPLNFLPSVLSFIIGLIALGYLAAIIASAQYCVVNALLKPRQKELQRQVAMLTVSRMTLLEAFESERRRIERNLHDGVQQQLVSLSLTLAIAELDLEAQAPPDTLLRRARESVATAHTQAQQTLTDLRDTVRGIHPQVLTKHGLGEAVRELIGRTPIDIDDDIQIDRRLPASIEASAYFTISECLTNAVKHSAATLIGIQLHATASSLTIQIYDNGNGGADPDNGTGIRGLQERIKVHAGTFTLTSQPGGPTRIDVAIPIPSTSRHHGDSIKERDLTR